jgi:Domain of unknown function (DUF4386)
VDRRTQIGCAVSGLLGGLLIGVGLLAVARIVPAPSASWDATRIASYFSSNQDQLRVGLLLAMLGVSLMLPMLVLIALLLKRSDPHLAPLAYTQLVAGATFMMLFLIPVLLWGAAVFRPDRSPVSTQTINDIASTIFYWGVSPGVVECAAMGLAVLLDRSEHPLFPRWVGYVDLAVAVAYAGGAPAIFVKTGPFGWDGLFSLWLPFAGFSVWLAVTFFSCIKAVDTPPAVVPATA